MNCNLIQIAFSQYGVTEIPGEVDNPEILKYFHSIGHTWVLNDEYAWCAAYLNWCLKKAGFEYTGKLNARSFLDIGEHVKDPEFFDIAILWRISRDGPYGHVGFFTNIDEKNRINLLGGNQANKVCILPYNQNKLLEYRRLKLVS